MLNLVLPLAGEEHLVNHTPVPAPVIGLIMFVALIVLLSIVRGIGHSRAHSEGDSSEGH